MLERRATPFVEEALRRQAAVGLIGPRQVGKTTLALAIGQQLNAIYLDLEDPDDRARLASPTLFLENVADRLVILDEIHRLPELLESLRGIIDRGRRDGRGRGRFLILGSASIDLLRHASESLAGRIAYIDLTPLTALEIENDHAARERLWLRGGFPDAYLADTDRDSLALRRDFIRTYLERDVPLFGPRVPATTLDRLWTMLAHRQGQPLNASDIARSLEVSSQTVTRYIDLLVDLLLVRRLPPLTVNLGKRLTKAPKVYVRDSGLVHALLGIETLEELAGHPVSGFSWEGYLIETLLSVLPWRATASYLRSHAGAEIDLIIDFPNGERWAVEIKRAASARPGRGFFAALESLAPTRAFVVHAGDDRYPISEAVEAIGVRALADLVSGAA